MHAGWIVPVEPRGQVLECHTLVIDNERNTALIPTAQWRPPELQVREAHCPDHVLIPGFVNAQTPAGLSLFGAPTPLGRFLLLVDFRLLGFSGLAPRVAGVLRLEVLTKYTIIPADVEQLSFAVRAREDSWER